MDENVENAQPSQPEGDAPQAEAAQDQPQQPAFEPDEDARMWAMLCHLLGLFTSFIGPLIIWLIKKDEDDFVDNQGKEALNFQITVLIAAIISGILIAVCIGVFMLAAVQIVNLVLCIVASAKSNSGVAYRYPICIRFIK